MAASASNGAPTGTSGPGKFRRNDAEAINLSHKTLKMHILEYSAQLKSPIFVCGEAGEALSAKMEG